VRAHRVRLIVLRDSRQRERDSEDRDGGASCNADGGKAADAIVRKHDPRDCGETCERDPEARVRQQHRQPGAVQQDRAGCRAASREPERDRHGNRGEQRELVPIVDGRAQAREPPVVGVERRDALREQRPAEQQRQQQCGAAHERLGGPLQERGRERAEQRERRVHERAVRVLPRVFGRDRPDRGGADPDREREQPGEEAGAGDVDLRRRTRAGEDRGGRGGDGEKRKCADPHERRKRRPPGEEERSKCKPAPSGGDDGSGGRSPFDQSAHRRGR
jgi:hypothetical protein